MKTDPTSYNFVPILLFVKVKGKAPSRMSNIGATRRTTSPFWEGLLFFLTIVMAIGVLVYAVVVLLHVAVRHTHFDPASPIGVLISDRYVTVGWWTLALSTLQLLIPALVYFVWIDTWLKSSRGWNVLWVILITLLVIVQFFVMVYFANARGNCNGQGQAGNLCNDLLWCCVPDIYLNVVNLCPPGPCGDAIPAVPIPETIDDLSPDGMFVALLWFNVAFFIISLLVLLILVGTILYQPSYTILKKVRRKKTSTPDDEEEEEDEEFVESQVVLNTGESVISRRRKSPPPSKSRNGSSISLEVPVTTLITRKMGSKNE